jgi:hypothetical protein
MEKYSSLSGPTTIPQGIIARMFFVISSTLVLLYYLIIWLIKIHFHITNPRDVVSFCEAASSSLMSALQDGNSTSNSTSSSSGSSDDSWLANPSELTPAQRQLLSRLPEHLIDDIMAMLLFVAKVEPAQLCGRYAKSIFLCVHII